MVDLKCPYLECSFSAKNNIGLTIHLLYKHKKTVMDWLTLIGFILAILGILISLYFGLTSSDDLNRTRIELNQTKYELNLTKSEIINNTLESKNEILQLIEQKCQYPASPQKGFDVMPVSAIIISISLIGLAAFFFLAGENRKIKKLK